LAEPFAVESEIERRAVGVKGGDEGGQVGFAIARAICWRGSGSVEDLEEGEK
jgi:hypothetical protein